MRFFFRSKQFKIILTSVLILLGITVTCVILGGELSPQADLMGTLLAPFRTAGTKISQSVGDFIATFTEGEEAQLMCQLHKKWLTFYWGKYEPQMHMGVAEMYVCDERFTAYYDKIAPGCAVFLRDAVKVFVGK